MRNLPGWMAGALSVGALVGAFYLGGRVGATSTEAAPLAPAADAASTSAVAEVIGRQELAVECEPGQRAVVTTTSGAAAGVACVSDARPVSRTLRPAYGPSGMGDQDVMQVADRNDRPYARPAVITEPVEVYRPRSRPARDDAREVAVPKRTVKKSVAIIAGSTAAGAVMGGLVKGKKGAVVGGLLGGGAATVWDQVTRRQDKGR
jgi:uncharacterized protein YcfJ